MKNMVIETVISSGHCLITLGWIASSPALDDELEPFNHVKTSLFVR